MSKLVQNQYDTNCYDSCDSQTCFNLFRINMIQTCLDLSKRWRNTSKFGWMTLVVPDDDDYYDDYKAIPRIASEA